MKTDLKAIQINSVDSCKLAISGDITDSETHEALEFAEVYITELSVGAVCDSTGWFHIPALCAGTYQLRISHIGCQPILSHITLKGRDTVLHITLPHSTNNLQEVIITDIKAREATTQKLSSISGKLLEKTRGQLLGEALQLIPGVNTLQTGPSIAKPVIHGMHSNRILIMNNGVRQEGQQWGSEHAPEIDPFIANNLEVVKGANAVQYGADAIAGVILVNPQPIRSKPGIDGEVNLVGSSNNRAGTVSGILEGNITKVPPLSWRIQGTAKRAGNSQTASYYLKNTGFSEYNYSGEIAYNKDRYGIDLFFSQFTSTLGIFSGAHIGNLSDLQDALKSNEPYEKSGFSYQIDRPYQHVIHSLTKLSSYWKPTDNSTFKLTIANQYNVRYEFDKSPPRNPALAALNKPELYFELNTTTTDLNWEYSVHPRLKTKVGLATMSQGNVVDGRYFIPNFKSESVGGYAIGRYKIGKALIELGLRYDTKNLQVFKYQNNLIINPIHRFNNVSYTSGLIYQANRNWEISLNIGTAWRAPSVNELYSDGVHHGAATFEIGDPTLTSEQAYNSIVSIVKKAGKLKIDMSLYHNYIQHFIYLVPSLPATVTIQGAFPTFRYKQVDAIFAGADLVWSYPITQRFSVESKGSFLSATDAQSGQFLALMPANRGDIGLNYAFPSNRWLQAPAVQLQVLHVTKQIHADETQDFAPAPQDYTLLNLDVSTDLAIHKQPMSVGLSVNNLLNRAYRDYLDHFRYYADAMGRNITLRVRIPF